MHNSEAWEHLWLCRIRIQELLIGPLISGTLTLSSSDFLPICMELWDSGGREAFLELTISYLLKLSKTISKEECASLLGQLQQALTEKSQSKTSSS